MIGYLREHALSAVRLHQAVRKLRNNKIQKNLSTEQQEDTMRCVFVGTGGFLGRIDSETRCAFWTGEPVDHGFDPKRLITIDLARTPTAAAAGEISWDAVQLDDCFTGPN